MTIWEKIQQLATNAHAAIDVIVIVVAAVAFLMALFSGRAVTLGRAIMAFLVAGVIIGLYNWIVGFSDLLTRTMNG